MVLVLPDERHAPAAVRRAATRSITAVIQGKFMFQFLKGSSPSARCSGRIVSLRLEYFTVTGFPDWGVLFASCPELSSQSDRNG